MYQTSTGSFCSRFCLLSFAARASLSSARALLKAILISGTGLIRPVSFPLSPLEAAAPALVVVGGGLLALWCELWASLRLLFLPRGEEIPAIGK